MWGFGVRMMKRVEGEVVGDGKMEVIKVFICGGLVVVVVYGIYICLCRLWYWLVCSYYEFESENNLIIVQVYFMLFFVFELLFFL